MYDPADIFNRALDAIGRPDLAIGAMDDGTQAARVARRVYGQTLRQLLRSSHWGFARKQDAMELLADSTGQTLAPNGQPISTIVEYPWRFAYAWPVDCVQARWVPWSGFQSGGTVAGNIAIPSTPLMPNLFANSGSFARQRPARFLVSTSSQYPVIEGQVNWSNLPDIDEIEGVGLTARRVVLTDVPCASLVYTMLAVEIELWDALFSQTMVAVLAERAAMALITDKKEAISVRNTQIAIARDALSQARVASANEAGFPQSVDQTPDWIRARRARAGYSGGFDEGGAGYTWCSWSPFAFGDGSVM